MILNFDFYRRQDVVQIARDLLGKELYTCNAKGDLTAGKIVETEAYGGIIDQASHAFGGSKTQRTQILYREGGVAYVYQCYGIHYLLNFVTNVADIPECVLIRAIEPLMGFELMKGRMAASALRRKSYTAGPGLLTRAMGIDHTFNGRLLQPTLIWVEKPGKEELFDIIASPRIGVAYAGEHAQWPWRFRIANHPFTSPAK